MTVDEDRPRPYLVLADGRVDILYRGRMDANGSVSMKDVVAVHAAHRGGFVPLERGDVFVGLRFRAGWAASCPFDFADVDETGLADGSRSLPALRAPLQLSEIARSLQSLVERSVVRPSSSALDILAVLARTPAAGVAEIAFAISASPRTLRRAMRIGFGCSPKEHERVSRFQRALRLCAQSSGNLAEVATDLGYADQSHMIREFRYFAGATPGSFAR